MWLFVEPFNLQFVFKTNSRFPVLSAESQIQNNSPWAVGAVIGGGVMLLIVVVVLLLHRRLEKNTTRHSPSVACLSLDKPCHHMCCLQR